LFVALTPSSEGQLLYDFYGASLKDPKGMFNAGLDAKKVRGIDFR